MSNLIAVLVDRLGSLLGDSHGGPRDGLFLLLRGMVDFSARVAGVVLVFVWTLILVRLLGPHDYGRYVYILSVTFFVSLLGGLGLPTASSYFVARYRRTARRNRLFSFLVLATTIGTLGPALGTLAVWSVVTVAGGTVFQGFDLLTIQAYAVGAALVQLYAFTNRALERTTIAAYGEQVLQRVWAFFWIGLVLMAGATITPNLALYGNAFGALGATAVMMVTIRRQVCGTALSARTTSRCLTLAPRWTRRAATMMITPVFFLVLSETDILMLGAFSTPAAVGIYHVARRICGFMGFFYSAVVLVGVHRFVGAHMENDTRRLQGLVRTMGLLGLVPAALLWLIFLVLGPWLLGMFGEEMTAGYLVLMIMATTTLLEMAMGPATELLMMTGHERPVSRINTVFAGVNIALNALLVPPLGMEGAAIASGIAILPWKATLLVLAWRRLGVVTAAVPLPGGMTRWFGPRA